MATTIVNLAPGVALHVDNAVIAGAISATINGEHTHTAHEHHRKPYKKARRPNSFKQWTDEEDAYLATNYPSESVRTIAHTLKRSTTGVWQRISKLRKMGKMR